MTKLETATERTRAVILDAAARVLGRYPDAAMADVADQAGVGRATLYRHFPTRESLLEGVADAATSELIEALDAANLEDLPLERAIARITSVFLRTGGKYAALMSQADHPQVDPQTKERVSRPVRGVIARGISGGVLRADLPGDLLLEMFSALMERVMWLTVAGTITPEAAVEAVVDVFLDGARL